MLLSLLIACEPDQGLFVYPTEDAPEETGLLDTGDAPQPPDSGEDSSEDSDAPDTEEEESGPRPPAVGELVISELMINPAGVGDEVGEWVELYSRADVPLTLGGLMLGDEGVDGALVAFSDEVVAPGGYLVLCASETSNGGVSCQGTYLYQSFGGGFALSNTEDEVLLIGADGTTLDTVRYGEGFSLTGQSVGVAPGCLDTASNDVISCWCGQSGGLSSGDQGNPGKTNNDC